MGNRRHARVALSSPPLAETRDSPTAIDVANPTRARRLPGCHWSRVFAVAGSVTGVALLAHLLSSYLPEAGAELRHPRLGWLTVAVAAELLSMGAFSEVQRIALRAGGTQVGIRSMLGLTFEANAVSESLPGGSAFATMYSFRRFRTWGSSAPAAGYALLVSGVLSTLAFGVVAAVAASVTGGHLAGPLPGVLAILAIVAVIVGAGQFRRHPAAANSVVKRSVEMINRVRRRPAAASQPRIFALVTAVAGIKPTAGMWSVALFYASTNWVADLACLFAASRAVGAGSATTGLVVIAYIAGMSVSTLTLAPGGLGVIEAAMIVTLSRAGMPEAKAIASVLLYRIVSYLFMMIIGWSVWLVARHRGAGRVVMTAS